MNNKNKLRFTVSGDDDKNQNIIINTENNLKTILLYSLCLLFAFGIDIALKNKEHQIVFYIIYNIAIISLIILLSTQMKTKISL